MALNVDLTLAVNYLPACACLGKMLVFMLALTAIPSESEVDGLVILAAVLYMDRLTTRNIIFDANAILMAVFFANVHAGIRATSTHRAYGGLVDGMFLCWSMGSLMLILEPAPVKRMFDKRARMAKIVPVLLMLLIVTCISHFHCVLEPGGLRACRAVAFTLLAFAWIYIVGIHTPHGIEYLKENSCQFVARLSPVLYVSPWVAIGFTFGAVGAFGVQFMRLVSVTEPSSVQAGAGNSSLRDMEAQIVTASEEPVQTPVKKPEEPEEDELQLFRQAWSQPGPRALRLDVIRETSKKRKS